jgi:hypothetical protein
MSMISDIAIGLMLCTDPSDGSLILSTVEISGVSLYVLLQKVATKEDLKQEVKYLTSNSVGKSDFLVSRFDAVETRLGGVKPDLVLSS